MNDIALRFDKSIAILFKRILHQNFNNSISTDYFCHNRHPVKQYLAWIKDCCQFHTIKCRNHVFYTFFCCVCSWTALILNYVRQKATKLWLSKLRLKQIHSIMKIGQYILISVIFTIVLQIVLFGYYDVILLSAVTTISYCLNYIILTTLGIRLLQWYLLRHDPVILVFSVGSFTAAIAAIATISFSVLIFGSSLPYASPETIMAFPTLVPGTLQYNLNYLNFIFSIISFIAIWCGAVLLLRHYSKKFGPKTYWVLVCIPLIYFLSQFANIFYLYEPFVVSNLNAYFQTFQLVHSLNSAIGGILFGIVFWTASKKMEQISTLKLYLARCRVSIYFVVIT